MLGVNSPPNPLLGIACKVQMCIEMSPQSGGVDIGGQVPKMFLLGYNEMFTSAQMSCFPSSITITFFWKLIPSSTHPMEGWQT